jgi:NADH-quinone oxidoreductase subunit G
MAEQTTQLETVTLTIDGREVTVPRGTNLLEAAERLGDRIPHYCYHPGLSRPAQCRLCLVEVEGMPKLLPSCVTPAMEGQVVHTQSEKARSQRTGVLEFYLQNHPLDCPICDQSGECKLQDYVHAEGRAHGRSQEPKRVFGRDDFGGDVLFYGDRCVMCTRCVRFMNEVAQDPRLTVVERGNRSVIDTFFEEGLHGSPYAGNVVDICPVGALVSKDFLHKARAWDLEKTPSVCPNCSQGCNIELHVRDNRVQRLKPRDNEAVNGHWMCDYGRERYEWMNQGGRLEQPIAQGQADAPLSWADALDRTEALLATVPAEGLALGVLTSPFASNETLAALRALLAGLGVEGGVFRSRRTEGEIPLPGFAQLARREDLAPNRTGAEAFGFSRVGEDSGKGGLDGLDGFNGGLLVVGDDIADLDPEVARRLRFVIHLCDGPAHPAATLALPIRTHAEMEGTWLNRDGRVQRFWPGLRSPGEALPAWKVLHQLRSRLGSGGEEATGSVPASPAEAFAICAHFHGGFAGLDWAHLGMHGAPLASGGEG